MADCLSANPPYRWGGTWLSADNGPPHTSSSRVGRARFYARHFRCDGMRSRLRISERPFRCPNVEQR